jgi:hypothetical protein
MSKPVREYHLIDLVGISHGGFVSLAGARQFARQERLSAWDIFHGNDRIEYHDPDDRERSDVKEKQDLWMCLLLHAPTHYPPS